jgi:RNA polymerase sigma-70 factor (ECF subfamily)
MAYRGPGGTLGRQHRPAGLPGGTDWGQRVTSKAQLEACFDGDEEAWDTFTIQVTPIIFAAVQRTLQHYAQSATIDDVYDYVQEAFLRLVKDGCRLLRSYDPARASMSTWLTLIARSVTIDQLRKRSVPTVPLPENGGPGVLPKAKPVDAPTDALEIPDTLLSPRQRLVLRLLYDRDMSVEEAAAALDVEPQTIRSTKHKALTRIREFFKSHGDVWGRRFV